MTKNHGQHALFAVTCFCDTAALVSWRVPGKDSGGHCGAAGGRVHIQPLLLNSHVSGSCSIICIMTEVQPHWTQQVLYTGSLGEGFTSLLSTKPCSPKSWGSETSLKCLRAFSQERWESESLGFQNFLGSQAPHAEASWVAGMALPFSYSCLRSFTSSRAPEFFYQSWTLGRSCINKEQKIQWLPMYHSGRIS